MPPHLGLTWALGPMAQRFWPSAMELFTFFASLFAIGVLLVCVCVSSPFPVV